MQREKFVLDTWHNSGAAPFASLSDDEYKKLYLLHFLRKELIRHAVGHTRY
uniref:Uncharacterized protein n=1 Tax=uncultured marine thaumarchaeote SAT1000_06_F08 TaxID=1456362 RepID=A0A075I013_9ARCH|nr:hypothetical protein [uncultured marine thaumarchaeote SAT1000_06_F08]